MQSPRRVGASGFRAVRLDLGCSRWGRGRCRLLWSQAWEASVWMTKKKVIEKKQFLEQVEEAAEVRQ